jgi:transcriptional regulator GlxA family with amidase domain
MAICYRELAVTMPIANSDITYAGIGTSVGWGPAQHRSDLYRNVIINDGTFYTYSAEAWKDKSRGDNAVERALEFIRRNASAGVHAADVIAMMGLARRSAEMRFRALTGRSIQEEILSVRLEKAKELLRKKSFPIKLVAEQCGYRDERSMRLLFRRATGMSMRDWRAKYAQ